jgi:signal peptidase I
MGDHRDNSFDSRFWGFAKRNVIVGRASRVVLSVDLAAHYRPRWRRFFLPLS